jgi:serine protease Do
MINPNSKYNMKAKVITTLVVIGMIPVIAFSQPPTPPTPPAPPAPPTVPGGRDERMPKVPVTYLGVETSEVPSVLCDQLGIQKGFGLVVDYVVPDGPAAAAGVQQNDIIKMLNDQILTDPSQLSKLVRNFQEGTNVTLTLMRKGQDQKVTVKLGKKEVPRRHAMGGMRQDGNFDFGDLSDIKEQIHEHMAELKERLGDQDRGVIHDAVMRARAEAQRAREEARRVADEARQNAERIRTITRRNGGLQQTTIDLKNAQIVFSDDKGELRIENKDGKKMLTAKDPQGKLLFGGPIETKEDLDKVPADVRQRYEKLQQHDLPAVSPGDLRAENDADEDEDDMDDEDEDTAKASSASYEQISFQQMAHRTWEIHTVLI